MPKIGFGVMFACATCALVFYFLGFLWTCTFWDAIALLVVWFFGIGIVPMANGLAADRAAGLVFEDDPERSAALWRKMKAEDKW